MMTVDTKRLRELAEAECKSREPNSDGMYSVGKSTLGTYMRFTAAANPQAIIALIDELENTKSQLAEANEALKFYGDEKNWMTTRKDELHEARMTIIQDPESFGQYDESWNVSTLLLIGGKRARQYIQKWKVGK